MGGGVSDRTRRWPREWRPEAPTRVPISIPLPTEQNFPPPPFASPSPPLRTLDQRLTSGVARAARGGTPPEHGGRAWFHSAYGRGRAPSESPPSGTWRAWGVRAAGGGGGGRIQLFLIPVPLPGRRRREQGPAGRVTWPAGSAGSCRRRRPPPASPRCAPAGGRPRDRRSEGGQNHHSGRRFAQCVE